MNRTDQANLLEHLIDKDPDKNYTVKLHSYKESTTLDTNVNHTQLTNDKMNNAFVMLTIWVMFTIIYQLLGYDKYQINNKYEPTPNTKKVTKYGIMIEHYLLSGLYYSTSALVSWYTCHLA